MISALKRFYSPEPAAPPIKDPEMVAIEYARWRKRMFFAMFFGYAFLYFCRKNISTAIPVMADELHYTNTDLGMIGSTLYVTYGLGKFANGVLADFANVRALLATALIGSGLLNLAFGSTSVLWMLAFLWGANGWMQSMGFPPIARGMTVWYPAEGKATRWAFWTCSHQIGTAAIMFFTAWILGWGGWRWCFWLPGMICIFLGFALYFVMTDTPAAQGLPPVEAFEEKAEDEEADYKTVFIRRVLFNWNVWVIGLADMCAYVVRYGALDWVPKFLKEARGYEASSAASSSAVMPLIGAVGVLAAGFASDRFFKSRYRAINVVSFAALALMLFAFIEMEKSHPLMELFLMAGIGFFVEVPQSLLGAVAAVDAGGSARVASAAAGLVGVLSYVGATLSGVGTGYILDRMGWGGAFAFWIGCAVIGMLLCLLAWKEAPPKK